MNIKESENFVEMWGSISSVKTLKTISEIKNDLNLSLLEWEVNGEEGFTSTHSFKTTVEREINAIGRCQFRALFQKGKLRNYQTNL